MYGLCFRYLAIFIMDTAEKALKRKDLEFDFVIEAGHKNAGDALRVFNQMKNDLTRDQCMRSLTFHDKTSFYGLQGADLFSHTAYLAEQHDEEQMELAEMPADGTLADAEKIVRRKGPLFRGVLGPDLLSEIKANTIAYDRNRIEFGKRPQRAPSDPAAASAQQSSEKLA
jgi:hypothetical protein